LKSRNHAKNPYDNLKDLKWIKIRQLSQTDKLHKKISVNIQQCSDIIWQVIKYFGIILKAKINEELFIKVQWS